MRGTDPEDCALACGGLGCGIEAACWDGGVNDIFCLMSSSTACTVAMLWAIKCFAPRRGCAWRDMERNCLFGGRLGWLVRLQTPDTDLWPIAINLRSMPARPPWC